jgi:alcohol dehydrogenase (NADP+)
MASPSEFHGWLAHNKTAASGTMTWSAFPLKPFNHIDINIRVSHCGICGTNSA